MTAASPTVLVTGFEPFGGATLNPSGEIVKLLAHLRDDVVTDILQVTYADAAQRVLQLVNEVRPQAVICLGQAAAGAYPQRLHPRSTYARAGR